MSVIVTANAFNLKLICEFSSVILNCTRPANNDHFNSDDFNVVVFDDEFK